MGVDIGTYRSRIGHFRQGYGLQVVQILVTCNFTGSLKMIGSVVFIGTLLLMAGIEPNPGPLPAKKSEDTLKVCLIFTSVNTKNVILHKRV